MSTGRPITIIGGGLAGLMLGIGLRRRGIPVTIQEAEGYPRHRVCGEFISGRGQDVLRRMGLEQSLFAGGARRAGTAVFFLGRAQLPSREITPAAWCLSRYTMDALLAAEFRAGGGELREHARWREPGFGEGIVRASGRRSGTAPQGWHWFGLKVHARGVHLEADLEMHLLRNGYVGICRLKGGEVNVCGLFRRRHGQPPAPGPGPLLRGPPGTSLHRRLEGAAFEQASFCAVAGLSLSPERGAGCEECRVGDALTMVPPVTGNGMSVAFESAALAVAPLAAYSRGEIPWGEAQRVIASVCDRAFARRLAWARWLHRLIFMAPLDQGMARLLCGSRCFWRLTLSRTR